MMTLEISKDVFAGIGVFFCIWRVLLLLIPTDSEVQLDEYLKCRILKFITKSISINTTQGFKTLSESGTKQLIIKLSRRLRKKQLLTNDELYLLNRFSIEIKNLFWKGH